MRRAWLLVLAVLAALATPAWPPPAPAGHRPPALELRGADPVVVRGTGFRRYERVRVSARAGGEVAVRRVRASRAGTFRATFGELVWDRCASDLRLRAVGSRGSEAVEKRPQLQCPPPLEPAPAG